VNHRCQDSAGYSRGALDLPLLFIADLPIEGFIIRVLKVTGTCDAMLELLDASGELQLSHSKRSIQVPVTFTHSRMMRPCLPMRGF
jgi:hypothetical protein